MLKSDREASIYPLITNCEKILNADDAVFYVSDADFCLCIEKLNRLIKKLEIWFNSQY